MIGLGFVLSATVMVSLSFGDTFKQHSLAISEEGAMFKQKTDVDLANKVIYIQVPAHRDLPESRIMYEFNSGRVLRCTPLIKHCYLSNFNTREIPSPEEEEFDLEQFAARHNSPRTEEKLEKIVRQDMVVTEKIKDLSILSKLMKHAVGGYALYREEPLPKGAVILKGKLDMNNVHERPKRSSNCPGGAYPVIRYARTSRFCNRMVLCSNWKDRDSCKLTTTTVFTPASVCAAQMNGFLESAYGVWSEQTTGN